MLVLVSAVLFIVLAPHMIVFLISLGKNFCFSLWLKLWSLFPVDNLVEFFQDLCITVSCYNTNFFYGAKIVWLAIIVLHILLHMFLYIQLAHMELGSL